MGLDSGILTLYDLQNVAPAGFKPRQGLVYIAEEFYELRTVGVTRLYAARGANASIDVLVRTWDNPEAIVNRYVVLEDGKQYRIDAVQVVQDDDGLQCRDLTLVRLEKLYDIVPEAD